MSWIKGEWYECTVKTFDYVESPVKKTKAFEMQCSHPVNGTVTGQWWLSDTKDKKGVPQWENARLRCIKLGCDPDKLNAEGWIEHARENVVGKTVACMIDIEEYQDKNGNDCERAVAQFIGIPSGNVSSGYAKVEGAPSPFAGREVTPARSFAADIDSDDVPF